MVERRITKDSKNYKTTIVSLAEMIITERKESYNKIKGTEAFKTNKALADELDNRTNDYWGNYNYLVPEKHDFSKY